MEFLVVLGEIVGVPALLSLSAILNGWVLTYLWLWFVTPLGLPSLSIAHAIGISCVISFLTYQYIERPKEKEPLQSQISTLVTVCVFRPLIVLGFGWIIHFFV